MARALPRFALDLSQPVPARIGGLFAPPVSDVWLEIGFGGGEHLLWQARHNPRIGLIGCEPFQDGVVKMLSAMDEQQLTNIRLYADDARPLLRRLPEAGIGRAFILFPDPWPKARHHKRRLVSAATLGELARIMRAGAELRIATDDADYARWILLAVVGQAEFRLDGGRPGGLAPARPRLAAHPLRAKGPESGPPMLLFPVPPEVIRACDNFFTSRLQCARFLPTICTLMIISTLRVGPRGPLFLFWAVVRASRDAKA